MNEPVIYIGFAQALFAALMIFLKRPLKIPDIILASWLIALAAMFGLNIFQKTHEIEVEMWFFSLSLSITFPIFLFLYSKYITVDFKRFNSFDFLHATPLVIAVLLIFIFRKTGDYEIQPAENVYSSLIWLRNYIGGMFNVVLWVYGILAIIKVIRYKKQINNQYSYSSGKISLTWLLVVVVSFIVLYSSIVVLSTLRETRIITSDIDLLRNLILLIYVYVLSIWGYRQNQLVTDNIPVKLNLLAPEKNETVSGKYQKSGLKNNQAGEYLQKLIECMNQTEIWKDAELSVARLSESTGIPKHHITQVLNENLGKNFYEFVNEYRVEFAKKLIITPQYAAWSFVAIAYESGFNSKTVFNSFFKKHTGMTPSEFKKSRVN